MDIYLQDLGRVRQTILIQWRASSPNEQRPRARPRTILNPVLAADRGTPTRLSWLGRCWARGIDSPPEIVAAGQNALYMRTCGINCCMGGLALGSWISPIIQPSDHAMAIGFACFGAVMVGIGLWMPGYWLRLVCRFVSPSEIEELQSSASDDLELAYLHLVADAAHQGVAPEAADRVRAALRAIGEAIDALPTVALPRVSVDTLRAEAAQAQAEARAEADAVVAASHERRADALERSASAAGRSQTLMRRAAALRREMLAQIESLRLGLAGFETARGDVNSLTSLADAVRAVAEESVSVADARTELDAALPGAAAEGAVLRMRSGA